MSSEAAAERPTGQECEGQRDLLELLPDELLLKISASMGLATLARSSSSCKRFNRMKEVLIMYPCFSSASSFSNSGKVAELDEAVKDVADRALHGMIGGVDFAVVFTTGFEFSSWAPVVRTLKKKLPEGVAIVGMKAAGLMGSDAAGRPFEIDPLDGMKKQGPHQAGVSLLLGRMPDAVVRTFSDQRQSRHRTKLMNGEGKEAAAVEEWLGLDRDNLNAHAFWMFFEGGGEEMDIDGRLAAIQTRYKGAVIVGGKSTAEESGIYFSPGRGQLKVDANMFSCSLRYVGLAICTRRDDPPPPAPSMPPRHNPLAACFSLRGLGAGYKLHPFHPNPANMVPGYNPPFPLRGTVWRNVHVELDEDEGVIEAIRAHDNCCNDCEMDDMLFDELDFRNNPGCSMVFWRAVRASTEAPDYKGVTHTLLMTGCAVVAHETEDQRLSFDQSDLPKLKEILSAGPKYVRCQLCFLQSEDVEQQLETELGTLRALYASPEATARVLNTSQATTGSIVKHQAPHQANAISEPPPASSAPSAHSVLMEDYYQAASLSAQAVGARSGPMALAVFNCVERGKKIFSLSLIDQEEDMSEAKVIDQVLGSGQPFIGAYVGGEVGPITGAYSSWRVSDHYNPKTALGGGGGEAGGNAGTCVMVAAAAMGSVDAPGREVSGRVLPMARDCELQGYTSMYAALG